MPTIQAAKQITERIVGAVNPEKVILFGSLADGSDKSGSDVDLFVVWNGPENLSPRTRRMILRRIIGRAGVPVDVLTYTTDEVEVALGDPRSFTSQVWRTGVVLHGCFNGSPSLVTSC